MKKHYYEQSATDVLKALAVSAEGLTEEQIVQQRVLHFGLGFQQRVRCSVVQWPL